MDADAIAHWVDMFVRSPGFAGVAAVVAASVAYRAARRTAAEQREIATRDRWWDQAKWAFDRLNEPTTQASALEAFDALLDRAQDDSEKAFVQAALRPGADYGAVDHLRADFDPLEAAREEEDT